MVSKLSFTTKDEWLSVRNTFVLPDEDGNYPSGSIYTAQIAEGSITIREVGHVPIAATYDEEGEILTEASFNEDWAVDIVSDYDLPVEDYIIENKHWYNEWV
jgi:hypothetical protein